MGQVASVEAYRRARARAEASEAVASERLSAVVAQMAGEGLSVRAIAAATGVPKSTIGRLVRGDKISRGAVDPVEYAAAVASSTVPAGEIDSAEARELLRRWRLESVESLVIAEQLAREVLAVVHPGLQVTAGVLMVAAVQVARDPETAYVVAGYGSAGDRQAKISSARGRAIYCRADWVDDADPLF